MKLDGVHHVTAITADAQANVDFYVGVLGLRLVKKTVNQDSTSVYHLFFADQSGSSGSDLTFFEYPGSPLGRPGAGMAHRIVWRVESLAALEFWDERLAAAGRAAMRLDSHLRFADPEGLDHELVIDQSGDAPLRAEHPEIPAEQALRGFDGIRAYSAKPERSRAALEETLGFKSHDATTWELRGEQRGGLYHYDEPPAERGVQGAGTIHHVAWSSLQQEQDAWRLRVAEAGLGPTPVIDRHYFKSVYFREPSGVLFEIATSGPGFTVDEPLERLGETLSLPPFIESQRSEIEAGLKPLNVPHSLGSTPGAARVAFG